MAITDTPKVIYSEADSNPTLKGTGSQIPVFIGITGNTTPAEGILKIKNFKEANRSVANGGIGTSIDTNPLLKAVKEFFEEVRKVTSSDITAPYIYVVDLGNATLSSGEGENKKVTQAWLDAMEAVKAKRDVQVEAYVGFKKTDALTDVIALMESAVESIKLDAATGNPRIAYYTVANATDEDLQDYTDETNGIQNPRCGLTEPKYFGKIIGKICTTPSDVEPGYIDFRSIKPGEFNKRTPAEELDLQNAGIIFIRDEIAGSEIHTRITLAVSTAFAAQQDLRANDSLLHARRNVDQLVRDVYDTLYVQLKRNETETNLSYLQSDIDRVIEDRLGKSLMPGTVLDVVESDIDPWDLKVEGVAVPVNSTLSIGFSLYIESPNATVTGGN